MIVARELGIPCVAGLPGATKMFKTGDLLRVDGAKGTIEVLETA
jgi:pyruvate,water dikinase